MNVRTSCLTTLGARYAFADAMKYTFEWLLFGMFILLNRMAAFAPAFLPSPVLRAAPHSALPASLVAELASRRNPRFTLLIIEPRAAP